MDELVDNLLYSVTFLEMDRWRRSNGPEPSTDVMRVHQNAERRLIERYGYEAYDKLLTQLRARLVFKTHPGLFFGAAMGVFLFGIYPRLLRAQAN